MNFASIGYGTVLKLFFSENKNIINTNVRIVLHNIVRLALLLYKSLSL